MQDISDNNTAEENEIAFGIHVLMTKSGDFGISVSGTPNLGEMQMLLSRALSGVEARMVGETVAEVLGSKSSIITPKVVPGDLHV